MNRLLVLAGAAAVAGCNPSKPPLPPPTLIETAPTPSHPAPTTEEVLGYIDGKRLPIPDDDEPLRVERGSARPADRQTIALERSKVTALELDARATQEIDRPWEREVRFLYADGPHFYAVVARVLYRHVDSRIAFFGFEVTEVARQ
jgi:hypothetical protein